MANWSGNTYNRNIDLPKWLKKLNPTKLQKYGRTKTSKKFMENYNYSSWDKDNIAERNNKKTLKHMVIKLNKNKNYL